MEETSIQELRDLITHLEGQNTERYEVQEPLREARNHLAYLTASTFIVVDHDCKVRAYGVTPEVNFFDGLHLNIDRNGQIFISCRFMDGSITLYLFPGGRVTFNIFDDRADAHTTFHIWAFAEKEAAEAWATARRTEHSCA